MPTPAFANLPADPLSSPPADDWIPDTVQQWSKASPEPPVEDWVPSTVQQWETPTPESPEDSIPDIVNKWADLDAAGPEDHWAPDSVRRWATQVDSASSDAEVSAQLSFLRPLFHCQQTLLDTRHRKRPKSILKPSLGRFDDRCDRCMQINQVCTPIKAGPCAECRHSRLPCSDNTLAMAHFKGKKMASEHMADGTQQSGGLSVATMSAEINNISLRLTEQQRDFDSVFAILDGIQDRQRHLEAAQQDINRRLDIQEGKRRRSPSTDSEMPQKRHKS